jgi:hypothetical protein
VAKAKKKMEESSRKMKGKYQVNTGEGNMWGKLPGKTPERVKWGGGADGQLKN